MQDLIEIIEQGFDQSGRLEKTADRERLVEAVNHSVALLDTGKARVAEKVDGDWQVNQWLKKAVLLSFRINENRVMDGGVNRYYDKVETKFASYTPDDFSKAGVRVVPNANARHGS